MEKRCMNAETVDRIGKDVTVKGWVHVRRDMGKLAFFDMRDRSGLVQVVLVPSELTERGREVMKDIRPEFCLAVTGVVQKRGAKQINPDLETGTVEVLAKDIEVLNPAKTLPFEIEDTSGVNEELRLKYRYLDLRSPRMLKNLEMRARVIQSLRTYLVGQGFLEVETPTLIKGTPEGSREYMVPSRLHAGKFYVLPQSPQQFKQLLMVAGVEKYFQIARCYRDEDARSDRQMEFTQLDLEMSFVEQEDVLRLVEDMMVSMIKEVAPEKKLTFKKFPRIRYQDSMDQYGNDKPDLRKDKDDPDELAFCWVVDYPMFEMDADGKLTTAHHPFCMVNPEDEEYLESEPLKVRAWSYDLVLNGVELSSGSIRIHEPEMQRKIFDILGLTDEEIQAKFGHMIEAFTYGAPPHGGAAPGIDRLVMLLCNEQPNMREVIAFPKTGDARDPMMDAPSTIDPKRLKEVHIAVERAAKKPGRKKI
ncbi:aspartate--tRNA ligase [Patescibacteria group bacterium]|nr:aspartate--tRNA ligase [Patescibacteria group bacterium]